VADEKNSAKAVMMLNGSIRMETPVSNTSPSYIGMGFRIFQDSRLSFLLSYLFCISQSIYLSAVKFIKKGLLFLYDRL